MTQQGGTTERFTSLGKQVLHDGKHYADACDNAAADVIATALNGGWQPIETAPHNKSVLLAWQDWRDGAWIMDVGAASFGHRNDVASNVSHHGSATHWMPLPNTPDTLSQSTGRAS